MILVVAQLGFGGISGEMYEQFRVFIILAEFRVWFPALMWQLTTVLTPIPVAPTHSSSLFGHLA